MRLPCNCRILDHINQLAAISANERFAVETVSPPASAAGQAATALVALVSRCAVQYLASVRNHPDSAVTHSALRATFRHGIQPMNVHAHDDRGASLRTAAARIVPQTERSGDGMPRRPDT